MVLVITGGITFGIFSPSEAAGMGAFASFVLAFSMRRLNWKKVRTVIAESSRMTVMLMGIIIASRVFYVRFLNHSGMTMAFIDWAMGLPMSWLAISMMMFVCFIFGMFIGGPLTYVTVPIFAPVVTALGYNLVWFGILMVKMVEMGGISPPVCTNLFIAQGIQPEVPLDKAYKTIWNFVACDAITIATLIVFPKITLWLPNLAGMGFR